MSWLMGLGGGSGGGKPPSPLIASSGKWLATCIGVYAAIFWTPDLWNAFGGQIIDAIYKRYEHEAALIIYWLLYLAAYPLMFFAVRFGLRLVAVSGLFAIITNMFGSRR